MEVRKIIGYEGYFVSSGGEVFSEKSGKLKRLSIFKNTKGYQRVGLMLNHHQKQVFVHRLVAEAFLGEIKEGFCVNHIDGNKENNNVSNLEIITHSENIIHSCYVLGNGVKPVYMLNRDTFERIKEFESITSAAEELGIDDAAIYRVCMNERNFAGDYSWIFKDDFSKENILNKTKRLNEGNGRKKVHQIDPKTNEIINSFDGVRIAERALGITTIKHCVSGRTKTAGGFKWIYTNEEDEL